MDLSPGEIQILLHSAKIWNLDSSLHHTAEERLIFISYDFHV